MSYKTLVRINLGLFAVNMFLYVDGSESSILFALLNVVTIVGCLYGESHEQQG